MPPNQQQYPPQQPVRPPYSPSPYDDFNPYSSLPPQKPRRTKWIVIIILLLVLVVGTAAAVIYASGQSKTPTTPASQSNQPKKATGTNNWTGKANSYKWSDAANWSLGKPQNGQTLHFDVSKVKQPVNDYGDSTAVLLDNDISDLSIKKLVFDGKVKDMLISIDGDPLTISDGIESTIVPTAAKPPETSSVPQVFLYNKVTFPGNATVKTTGKNSLTFYRDSGTSVELKKTLKLTASGTSNISVSGAVAGTGTIEFTENSIADTAFASFTTASPDFDGKVIIGKGNLVHVGNRNTTGTVNAFGDSSIQIADGGALKVLGTHATTFTIDNDITMAGVGVAWKAGNTGATTGAISVCLTSAEQGCEANVAVTLGGKIKLTGDTQFGAQYGGEDFVVPIDITTATFILENTISSNYQLGAVPASLVIIQQK